MAEPDHAARGESAPTPDRLLEAVSAHVERSFGPVAVVLREVVGGDARLDLLVVEPSVERPFWTLTTVGISARPMGAAGAARRAELVLTVMDLRRDAQSWRDEPQAWPIRQLEQIARYLHATGAALAEGQTIAAAEPPQAVAPGVPFCGFGLLAPIAPAARRLAADDGTEIELLQLVPLHAAELQVVRAGGAARLAELFESEFVRVAFGERPCLVGPAMDSEIAGMFDDVRRGGRWLVAVAVVLATTALADFAACHVDGARLPWSRTCCALLLASSLGQGKRWARWLTVALCALGVAFGGLAIAQQGVASARLLVLAVSLPLWLATAVALAFAPSVRQRFRALGAGPPPRTGTRAGRPFARG